MVATSPGLRFSTRLTRVPITYAKIVVPNTSLMMLTVISELDRRDTPTSPYLSDMRMIHLLLPRDWHDWEGYWLYPYPTVVIVVKAQ